MHAFAYRRPRDCVEAAALLKAEPDAKILGGGMTLLPTMKLRLAAPPVLVDVSHLQELAGIERAGQSVRVGAATRHAVVASSAVVRDVLPGLAGLAAVIGDPMVRNRGTLGGSLANNDPAADYPAAALALHARIRTNQRTLTAEAFFAGLYATALDDGEIIVDVEFAIPARSGYAKLRHQASRFAKCGVFVAQWPDASVTVAVTGAGNNGVFRFAEMERALEVEFSARRLTGIMPDETDMITDFAAEGRYRAHLVNVMARRAVAALSPTG